MAPPLSDLAISSESPPPCGWHRSSSRLVSRCLLPPRGPSFCSQGGDLSTRGRGDSSLLTCRVSSMGGTWGVLGALGFRKWTGRGGIWFCRCGAPTWGRSHLFLRGGPVLPWGGISLHLPCGCQFLAFPFGAHLRLCAHCITGWIASD